MFDTQVTPVALRPVTSPRGGLSASRVRAWAGVLAGDVAAAGDQQRLDLIEALEQLKNAAAGAQALLAVDLAASQRDEQEAAGVRPSELGTGVAEQVALARAESPHRGRTLLGLARALADELPHTFEALRSGRLSEYRAALVARETSCLGREDRRVVDAELWQDVDAVLGLGNRALAARTKRLAYRIDARSVVRRVARAESERSVTIRPAPDCMTYVTALLPVAQGVAVYASLCRAADTHRAAPGGDVRGRGQLMADTLVERVTGQGSASAVPVRINLVMTDPTLMSGGREPGLVLGHGPVPAAVARKLALIGDTAASASIRRLYTRPGDHALVALESRSRRFRGGLADFVTLRDQTCRTPWCDAPIRHLDHVVEHASGGETAAVDGQGLCEACNYTKQALGWRARPGPDGSVVTTTSLGKSYTSRPPGLPRAHPGWPVTTVRWGELVS